MNKLRWPPKLNYIGLTIVMANQSRFDKGDAILQANGGMYLDACLYPNANRYQCDIRLKECKDPYLPNTKAVLLLGSNAMHTVLPQLLPYTLGEYRGSPILKDDIYHISSYLPQDCMDMQDYEGQFNEILMEENANFDEPADKAGLKLEKSRHGKTDRNNWKFWLKRDIDKCFGIIHGKLTKEKDPTYIIYPSSKDVIDILRSHKNKSLTIDIETDYENLNMLCFSFAFTLHSVYVVPVLRHDYSIAYSDMSRIMQALAIGLSENEVVGHNISGFDLPVLALKYRIPFGRRLYDTMIAHSRCFPSVEKSLSHAMSNFTMEPFHKDEGGGGYNNLKQAEAMWSYNGKDVFGTMLVRRAIDEYASKVPGLADSIKQANESIRPYIICSLTGIRYDADMLSATMLENDRLMMHYLRFMHILTGGFKPLISNKICCSYFHDHLGYPVVMRSKKTKKPSLDEKSLLKLKLKHSENATIDVLLKYRKVKKESGSLKFTPYEQGVL